MKERENIDIDYEHMDDLPLTEHIEWKHLQVEEAINHDLEQDQSDWTSA